MNTRPNGPLAVYTYLRVEVLDTRAGRILPRPPGQRWQSAPASELTWRWHHRIQPHDRRLAPEERARMEREVVQGAAANELRSTLGGLGKLQYPLVALIVGCPHACGTRISQILRIFADGWPSCRTLNPRKSAASAESAFRIFTAEDPENPEDAELALSPQDPLGSLVSAGSSPGGRAISVTGRPA